MRTVSVSDPDTPRDTSTLRELRAALEQFTRELMEWIALLRHKALALRAIAGKSGGSTRSLTPGFLDPRVLADALAANMPRVRPDFPMLGPLQRVGQGAEEVLDRARALWERVADPADAQACLDLADAAEALAAQLQQRVDEALDEYEALGDELTLALARRSAASPADPRATQPTTDDPPGRTA